MPVLVTAQVENQTEQLYDSMLWALVSQLKQADGFIMHSAHRAADTGQWRVLKVWNTKAQADQFFAWFVAPNLPPGVRPKRSVVELHSLVTPGGLTVLSNRLIHTAVAFFVIGVALGTYMGAQQDFRFVHVHAHLNLLGWVALGMMGLIYRLHPHLQQGWLAHAHYWLHTVGLVVFMGAFAWGVATDAKPVPLIAAGATMVSLAVLLFAINVFTRLRNSTANYR